MIIVNSFLNLFPKYVIIFNKKSRRLNIIMKKFKWGILGPGAISQAFVSDLKLLEEAELYAVGSRSLEKAQSYAKEYSIPKAYSSYEELTQDPEVEIIYIATPHPFHKEWAIKCLEAGKAVLCEKPITINAEDAKEIYDAAKKNNAFFMEAMWTRFLPVMVKVREWIRSGAIGEIRMVKADFGFRANIDPEGRLFNPELAGGALLDVGIYPISFAYMIFGKSPVEIISTAHLGETGVDEQGASIFKYDTGELAILDSSIRTSTLSEACILGTKGNIKIPSQFWRAKAAILNVEGEESLIYEDNRNSIGYYFEAKEVMECLSKGLKESPVITLEESLDIMKTMDTIRNQYGLKYPFEK
jgi:dihydrodiol dehydrogenase / D-xylose 1-dehydrogenase (NADP)